MLDVVDHPPRSAGVADDRVHRAEQRDVDRPDGAYGFDGVGHPGVEHRDEPGPAVAGRVPVALEFDEDDVGLVDAALRMLPRLSGTFTATAACRALLSFFSSLPVSGQRGRVSIEGVGPGFALGSRAGCWVAVSKEPSPSPWNRRRARGDHSQQGRAAADPRHVKTSVRR